MKTTRFEPIFRAISLPCLVLKPQEEQFLIVDANEAYLNITGSASSDLIGKFGFDAFPDNPDSGSFGTDNLLGSLRKVTREKEKHRMELLRFDIPVRGTSEFLEKYWNIENVPVLDETGELEYVLHMVQDVTEQILSKRKEQRLQKEAERNRQQNSHFVEANPNGLYSLSPEGKFLNANNSLARMAELPLEELLKMDFLPFCSEEDRDRTLEEFQNALNGEPTKFEAKFVSAKANDLILEVSLSPMRAGGQIIGVYGIARDLTSLRQSEKIVVTRKNYLQANAAFINSLLQNELTESVLHDPLGMIGEAVDVDSIHYFLAHPCPEIRERMLSLHMEWFNDKAEPQKDRPEFRNFPVSKLEELIGRLDGNRPFTANISELPEGELKQLLQSQHAQATLVLPIFLKNRLHGLIVLNDCIRERHWSEEEFLFLKTLANNLTTTFENRAAKAALKEQQAALKLSEQKFRALVQESADLFAIMDLQGNFKFKSDSSTRIMGTDPEEYVGRNSLDFIHPEDREAVTRQYASLGTTRQFKLTPYRFRNKQGEWRWLETTLTNLSEDRAVKGVVANSRDITTIRAQEREIRQLNERYRLAAAATQDLMYDWDMETNQVIRFHKGKDFLGHPIMAMDERYFWRRNIHPEELDDLREKQEKILLDKEQDHINAEYRFRRADGSYAHLIDRAYIIRNSKGKAIRMVGATSDISDLKAKEEALKTANERFKLAMKATKEMIWDWDMSTGNIKWGRVFKEIFGNGVSKEKRAPDLWYTKIHPEDRVRVESSLAAAIKDPAIRKWREEYRMIKLNGGIAYMDDRAFIVRDPSGQAIRMVGSVLDATESRAAMKRIKKQNQLLLEIAWDQSHLVRAPLARMKSLLDLLSLGETSVLTNDDILEHLNASYEELDLIVRNIVRKSEKVEQGKPV